MAKAIAVMSNAVATSIWKTRTRAAHPPRLWTAVRSWMGHTRCKGPWHPVYDSQISGSYGLKVASTENRARVLVLKNAVWGVDDQNRVRFQLFTDGTLHLFNSNYEETITLDGDNGQILIRGRKIADFSRIAPPKEQ